MQDMCVCYRSSSSRCPSWLVLLVLVLTGVCSARPKKDVIQFANGDRLTCEIIKLEKGYLYIKLDYADGRVSIDWSKIVRIESPQSFVVSDNDEKRHTGGLKTVTEGTSPEGLKVQVTGPSTSEIVSGTEVVGIGQTDTSFWQNLHGGIDAGFNYTKQENRAQYSFDANAVFARTKWSTGADYNSSFTGGGDLSSLRNDLRLNGVRQLRSPRNYYMGVVEFLHNGEQQLDLRSTVGGALGHLFSQTNHSLIGAYGGVVWNREHYSSQASGQGGDSAEAILGTQLNFFQFKTTNFLVDARVYPSLTDLGRTRFDLNTSLKLRIAKDLYWKISYYLNVDSRPPQNLPKTDYGSTASLGWTF
jgi:putative salt-induced outer membrane protein YdiY